MQRDSESFLADLRRKGYESLATLLTDPTITFYEDKESGIHGFEWGLKGFEMSLKEFENGLRGFVSVWQGTRNLELRNALRKDVLLHKQVLDEVENKVPMNEALERVFDAVGGEARSMDAIHADLMKYVGTIESHLASHRFLPAYVLYLQLLQTVSRRYLSDDRETLCPRSAYLPDKACTAAHDLITSYIADNTDEVTKEIIEEYRPVIKHLRKSPSFLAFRIPSCL